MADDSDKFMKEMGYPGGGGSVSRETPSPSQETRAAPRYEDLDWQQKMGQGVAKAVAGVATGVPKLINRGIGLASPSLAENLGDLAERIPGVKRAEDFAASESEGGWETAGNIGAQGAMLFAGPGELKLGEKLASKFPTASFAGGGKGFVPKPRPWVKSVGDVAELAGRGAVAGAATDPTDPMTGAVVGGLTGGLPLGAAKLAGTKAGQYMAGQAARHIPVAATLGLAHALGVPTQMLWAIGVPELFAFYHSPIGRQLHRGGARVAELIGRAVEQGNPNLPRGTAQKIAAFLTDPRLAGGAAGKGAAAAFGSDAVQGYLNPAEAEAADAEPEGPRP